MVSNRSVPRTEIQRTYKFLQPDPEVGYYGAKLLLPKKYHASFQIMSPLTYEFKGGKTIRAYEELEHHWEVPRNFLSPSLLGSRPYKIRDIRPQHYEAVNFRNRIQLDKFSEGGTYQRDGVAAVLSDPTDCVLSLRCGAGKTVCALYMAAVINGPTLILADEKGLCAQWISEIKTHLGVPEDEIGICMGGKFDWRHKITVATLHTIAQRNAEGRIPPEMKNFFKLIIPDECHVLGAPYFNTSIAPFPGRRIALSATPHRVDGLDSLVRYTVGRVRYKYLLPDKMPEVHFRHLPTMLNYRDPDVLLAVTDKKRDLHLGKLYSYLSGYEQRVSRIVTDVRALLDSGREILVLTHSRKLCEILASHFPNGGAIHGGMKGPDIERITQSCNPLVAIMQKGNKALNKPSLNTVVICEPFTKEANLQQTMGRALRNTDASNDKTRVVLVYEDVHIQEMAGMCEKMRKLLRAWPAEQGGRIPYYIKRMA